MELISNQTIAAVATPPGSGGIAAIRLSGPRALEIASSAWKGCDLANATTHTLHHGKYISTDGNLIDEPVAAIFRAPHSFTGEDTVELYIHGSRWIQREIVADLIRRGAIAAAPGEFSQRAFLNGKIDLAQAEGIADLIAASSRSAHDIAISQTKGLFSQRLESLRTKLTDFASLLELELDFSEEDVEFADRKQLKSLALEILAETEYLAHSYSTGKVIKEGWPTVIAGIPNAGKSSLLNLLAEDDKAIVSDIAGTTRDIIEETLEINGVLFRITDTAGLRKPTDRIEQIGIRKALEKLESAYSVIWVLDSASPLLPQIAEFPLNHINKYRTNIIPLINKIDLADNPEGKIHEIKNMLHPHGFEAQILENAISCSMTTREGLSALRTKLWEQATADIADRADITVTNARHYSALTKSGESLRRAIAGLENGISADFISQDIRETLQEIGEITGAVTTDTLLHNIFSRFCIGK